MTAATAPPCRPITPSCKRTVVLMRQFRYPAYVNGYDDLLIEAAAGVLDERNAAGGEDPRRGGGRDRLPARRDQENLRGLLKSALGDRETALLHRRI